MNDEKITLDLVIDVQKDFITGALANTGAGQCGAPGRDRAGTRAGRALDVLYP